LLGLFSFGDKPTMAMEDASPRSRAISDGCRRASKVCIEKNI